MTVDPAMFSSDSDVLEHARARAIAYLDLVFDTAEQDLLHGDAASRGAAYKNVLPHLLALVRATSEEEDSAAKTAKEEAMQLLDQYRATLPSTEPLGGQD